jgi:putative ABC transport system ATP-binding protein
MDKYIELKDVKKYYQMGEVKIKALDGVTFSIDKGEFVVVAGPSGAGKSTVLNILGGMDSTSSGEILVDGNEINKYNSKQLTTYRRYDIGFVFQFYNLVQNLTAIENIELATQICKDPIDPELVIEEVGLKERRDNFPS